MKVLTKKIRKITFMKGAGECTRRASKLKLHIEALLVTITTLAITTRYHHTKACTGQWMKVFTKSWCPLCLAV